MRAHRLQVPLYPPTHNGCTAPVPAQEVERYKQAFGQPGAPTATINYYRNVFGGATYAPEPVLVK